MKMINDNAAKMKSRYEVKYDANIIKSSKDPRNGEDSSD
jgi:hypothetical protein